MIPCRRLLPSLRPKKSSERFRQPAICHRTGYWPAFAALLRYHCDGPARRTRLMLLDRTDHPRDRRSIQHHSRRLAAILGETATSGLCRISNFDRLHESPKVAVRETIPRRSARYRATVNNDSDPARQSGLPRNRVLTKEAQKRLFASTAVQVTATNVTTYAGEWASELSQCRQDNVSDRSVTSITQRRAEAFGTTCDFDSVERESAAWRIRAKCTRDNNTWTANIRFLRAGNKLIWSSERGIATYVQCIGTGSR
jgi:hypothetical protein